MSKSRINLKSRWSLIEVLAEARVRTEVPERVWELVQEYVDDFIWEYTWPDIVVRVRDHISS